METIYIETTVVSYLVANPSRDSILAAHQQVTRQWWQNERMRYHCVTSREVLRESSLGDAEMSRRRAEALANFTVLSVEDSARDVVREILAKKLLPPNAAVDAIHAVVASQNRIDILLTWNCRHLANPHLLGKLRRFMASHGLALPEVCTPIELIGE
jgi:predicted nucleic acid-binding protein